MDGWKTDDVSSLVIAGWTGRDETALRAHIRELEELGVAAPKRTPIFYRVSASLLTNAPQIEVMGKESSGEVEFVLFSRDGRLLVGVGSDHTDRKAEAIGVTLSKQLCAKPVSTETWEFADAEPHWDELILRAYMEEDGRRVLYQQGSVAAMRHPRDLLARYESEHSGGFSNAAMFCGTFAVIGGIRWSEAFHLELEDPRLGRRLTHSYRIAALPVEG